MRVFSALVFSLLLMPVFLSAQSLYLKSGTYQLDASGLSTGLPAKGEVVAGHYYRLVQFVRLPLQDEKAAMERSGVKFIEYLPDNAYLVSIPAGITPAEAFKSTPVHAEIVIPEVFKVHPLLLSRQYPDYMVTDDGRLKISVVCFEAEARELVAATLATVGQVRLAKFSDRVVEMIVTHQDITRIALTPGVNFIEPGNPPAEPENLPGRTNHRSNMIATSYSGGRKYDGTGVVVAMGDDGFIGPHIDYHGRIDQTNAGPSSGNHGDHVAGTIIGAGNLDPVTRGMAFGATLYVYDVWDAINSSMSDYISDGVRLTSTSYSNGCNAGYTSFAMSVDNMTNSRKGLLHVFSAGNNGTSDCGYGAGAGWGNVTGGVKVGKNVIAVANITNADNLSNSSSRGPAHDGRIKPEVSAVGTSVLSTVDVNTYASFSGTSMACPGTSGTLAQLYHAYRMQNANADPYAGLMKGILMNTADDLGNPGPDYRYGFGRINGIKAARVIEQNKYLHDSVSQLQQKIHQITVPAGVSEVKVMVYWTDFPGSVNSSKALVNDLRFQLTDPNGIAWDPWVLNPAPTVAALNSNATRLLDTLNNQEQITLQSPMAGTYTATITGQSVPQGPQDYFLTWIFLNDSVEVTYPSGGEAVVPGETEIIRWDAFGTNGTFHIEYSTNNGTSWNTIVAAAGASLRNWNWTVPSTLTGQALIRITRNGVSDVSDAPFSIMTVPTGLSVDWACPDSIKLSWNALANATLYEVSMLGQKYMDSIGTTANTSIVVYNTNPLNDYWFSVRAYGPLNASGRRALAINKAPGIVSCPMAFDAAVTTLVSPNGVLQGCHNTSATPVTIEIENTGQNALSNIPVFYSVNGGAAVAGTIAGPVASGASVTYTFSTPANLGLAGNYQLSAWAAYGGDGNSFNDSAFASVQVTSATGVSAPWSEDFETFSLCPTATNCEQTSCNMTNGFINISNLAGDDIDWRTDNNGTASSGTGPSIDHAPGTSNGKYLYLETSNGCDQKTAMLLTPCIDLTGAVGPEFRFWYHMFGSDMGALHVDAFSNGVWTNDVMTPISGDKGNQWLQGMVNLSAYTGSTVTLRFRGVTATGFEGDMALDDFSLIDNATTTAGFYNSTPPCVGQPVTFTDQSTGLNLNYNWNFGANASPATASTAGPHQVSFSTAGTHQVTLIVNGTTGADTITIPVQVNDKPNAAFTWSPTSNMLTVSFINTATGATSHFWDFGDGTTSNWINPTHAFTGPGPFTVMQILSNECGTDTAITVLNFTGISEHNGRSVLLYPNPSGGDVTLQITGFSGSAEYVLNDMSGRKVAEGIVNQAKTTLSLEHLARGVYFVVVRDEAGGKVVTRLVRD